jgi:hypothetical protein
MKSFNTICATVLLVGGTSLLSAQHLPVPGTLATSSGAFSSSSAFTAAGVPVAPRPDIISIEDKHDKRMKALWIASIAAMVAGTSLDAASSWHKRESNGLLASSDGTFGGKGVGIKVGIGAAVLIPQIIFRRHKELRGAFAIGNFAEAGIFTGAAIHNFGIRAPKQ